MPLDTIIDYPCAPKRELGQGDLRIGTQKLLELLRVKIKADAVHAMAAAEGKSSDAIEIKIVIPNDAGVPAEQTVTMGELDRKLSVLDPHVPVCTNCPVNGLRRPFGCINSVAYPIKKTAERWLLDRVQPPTSIGGSLILQAIEDNQYNGELTRGYRADGKLQAFPGLERELPKNPFEKEEITGDELFQPFLVSMTKLAPWQCLQILLWFGAIKVDEQVPTTVEDARKLTRMEPAERARKAKLHIGISTADLGVEDIRNMIKTFFVGWVRDVDVLIDS